MESTPSFTPLPSPPPGAPNVVVIVLDDLGFGQLGCFGSDIDTPAIDNLAAEGLRYNRFHVTALCSPTRAALLTGRNHHAVGMGFLTDIPLGFPGYTGRIPKSAATLPRVLKDQGYNTFAVGKWHLAPRWEQSASGPFELWPLGLGFERYYGFLAGDTNQWTPHLVSDNGFVEPPARPEDGYHLTEDLVDRAIRFVLDQKQATPDKPFFLYFCPGAMHAPHHAPREWIDRYRGRFDRGWDDWRRAVFTRQLELGIVPGGTNLPERPPWVAAWDSLTDAERRLFARMMEVFAGFLSHTDHQIGRLVDFLRAIDQLDNTLVLLISDNGASAEGGPYGSLNEHRFTHDLLDDLADTLAHIDDLGGFRSYNHYPWGWAWAGNTPLRLWKRYTWLGGVRTPLIVRWPANITDAGAIRTQFCHVIDLMPTILDAVGIGIPAVVDGITQQPVDGASLLPTFADASAPSPRSTQYFEMLGSRAIYHDGWKATTNHVGQQLSVETERLEGSRNFEADHWALFHLDRDFSESTDVSAQHPEIVARLRDLWWSEAGRNNVLPIDDSLLGRIGALEPNPHPPSWRCVYRPGGGGVAEDLLPALGAGFVLRARVSIRTETERDGVICALGDWNNGFALFVLDGRVSAAINLFGNPTVLSTDQPLPVGDHELRLVYQRHGGGGGPLSLSINSQAVAIAALPRDLPFRWQIGGAGLLIGRDSGFPVCDLYQPPFPFQGQLHEVMLESVALAPPEASEHLRTELRHE
ncbi:MAG: arylsulfatase [Acidimicrobiales bacterium]|nr:arylsulfatase [Acidimicrobiales bacterium]